MCNDASPADDDEAPVHQKVVSLQQKVFPLQQKVFPLQQKVFPVAQDALHLLNDDTALQQGDVHETQECFFKSKKVNNEHQDKLVAAQECFFYEWGMGNMATEIPAMRQLFYSRWRREVLKRAKAAK